MAQSPAGTQIIFLYHRAYLLNGFRLFSTGVQLSFDASSYTVDEDAGVISVCVQLSGQLVVGRVLIATLSTMPGSAIGMYIHSL